MDRAQIENSFYDREEEMDYIRTQCVKMLDRAVAYKEECSPHGLLESVLNRTPYAFVHLSEKEVEEECEDCYLDFFREPQTDYFDVVR